MAKSNQVAGSIGAQEPARVTMADIHAAFNRAKDPGRTPIVVGVGKDVYKGRLEGTPDALTAEQIAELAGKQGDKGVRLSSPRVQVSPTEKASKSKVLTADEAREFFLLAGRATAAEDIAASA